MRATGPDGRQLDAEFGLEAGPAGFDVIIESRSGKLTGGPPPRNPHYEKLLELLLTRAGASGAVLLGAWVESGDTEHLSADDRLLEPEGTPYPIDLSAVREFRGLRILISRPQGGIGRKPGARGPGNRNKRIRLRFATPASATTDAIKAALVLGDIDFRSALDQVATPVPSAGAPAGELTPSWRLGALQAALERYESASPKTRVWISRHIERGPLGEYAKRANGYRCQICGDRPGGGSGFNTRAGRPYVEAHHVVLVSTRGAGVLRAENIITLCPNHHRELHYGSGTEVLDLGNAFRVRVSTGTVTIPKLDLRSAAG